jgi:hypothetical protein
MEAIDIVILMPLSTRVDPLIKGTRLGLLGKTISLIPRTAPLSKQLHSKLLRRSCITAVSK